MKDALPSSAGPTPLLITKLYSAAVPVFGMLPAAATLAALAYWVGGLFL